MLPPPIPIKRVCWVLSFVIERIVLTNSSRAPDSFIINIISIVKATAKVIAKALMIP